MSKENIADKNNKILFIITGGTIDSQLDGYDGISVFKEGQKSLIPEYINDKHDNSNHEFNTICMEDSGDIVNDVAIKQSILNTIDEADTNRIIITHGTDTMADMAGFIKNNMQRDDATIVMVGAMSPLRSDDTDGYKNLDFAVEKVQELDSGVYIAMHNQVFSAKNVRKDFANKKFVELLKEDGHSNSNHTPPKQQR